VRAAAPEAPIVVGSGATPDTLSALFELSDAIIVGTALKEGGRVTSRVDPARAASFVTAAGL
jgi:predicted TIM-barrel enzyme